MTQYLGVWREPDGYHVALTEVPNEILVLSGGRTSQVFHVAGLSVDRLNGPCQVHLIFPRSPRRTLADLADVVPRRHGDATVFMTHGLAAAVVLAPPVASVEDLVGADALTRIISVESWTIDESGKVVETSFDNREDIQDLNFAEVPTDDLPYEARTEIEQFNLNLRRFWTRAARYSPEYGDLVTSLNESVLDAAEAVAENLRSGMDADEILEAHYGNVSRLVEINSCLTMLTSQAVQVVPSVMSAEGYPVGAFSLLGIGSATRAAWRLYQQIGDVFAAENTLDRLSNVKSGPAFDAGHLRPFAMNLDTWQHSVSRMSDEEVSSDELGRRHIVYFSSRWGFHQTQYSVSISWQCIQGCASQEWNLLTLSHEFLHSHLRELLDEILLDPALANDLVGVYNTHTAESWGQSAVQLLIRSLRAIKDGLSMEQSIIKELPNPVVMHRPEPITQIELDELVTGHLRFLEEIVVHVMDFVYFYDSDDNLFVSSLWQSWALVPNVQPQLSKYLLRCLLALSSTWTTAEGGQAFDDAVTRLKRSFDEMLAAEGENVLVELAADLLENEKAKAALRARFLGLFVLVRFVKTFLISQRLHSDLLRDEQTLGDGSYAIAPGEFPDQQVESPVGFLLDRYRHMHRADVTLHVERDSLWQLLVIL